MAAVRLAWLVVACGLLARAATAQELATTPVLRIETGMHTAIIRDAAMDKAGTVLVTASDDKTARVWTLPDLRPVRVLRPPVGPGKVGEVYALAVSPDGAWAALGGWLSASADQYVVELFDLKSGRLARQLPVPAGAKALAISSGGVLAAGLGAGGVRFWRLVDGAPLPGDAAYSDQVFGLDFAADGRLAAASLDGAVRLYDTGLYLVRKQATQAGTQPFRVRFSPDGQDVAVGFADKAAVEVRAARDLSLRTTPDVDGLTGGNLSVVAWGADGQTLLAGGRVTTDADESPVLSWASRGAGPRSSTSLGLHDTLTAILVRPNGDRFVSEFEPAFGVWGADRQRKGWQPRPIVDLRSWSDSDAPARLLFRLSANGSVVETDREDDRGHVLRLDIDALALTHPDAADTRLASWQNAVPGLQPLHWNSEPAPEWNGHRPELEDNDLSRAIDVRQNRVLLGTSYSLRLFDAAGRPLWPNPVAITGEAWRVAQSPDGRLAVAALGDGTVRWYRADTGTELLAMFLHADGKRWVAFTPGGYYAASPGGEDLIGWTVNNGPSQAADSFPASRFRDRFYRPDVVQRVLHTLDEAQAVQQADAARGTAGRPAPSTAALAQDVLRNRPPVVTILSPQPGTALTADNAELEVDIRSPNGRPITRLDVRRDGQLLTGVQASVADDGSGHRHLSVPVPSGQDVTLDVIAWTDDLVSAPATIALRGQFVAQLPTPDLRKPILYAVLVGVSAYQDKTLQLKFAAKDADDLAAALQSQKNGPIYGDVQIRELKDQQVTREAVIQALRWLNRSMTDPDVALLFLSGHGDDGSGRYYFLPADATQENMDYKGLSDQDIKQQLGSTAGKRVLFIDTCYAGSLTNGWKGGVQVDMNKLGNELASAESGIVVFSATTSHQRAAELDELRNGVFTRALLDVITGKLGRPKDGAFRQDNLAAALADDVKLLSRGQQSSSHYAFGSVTNFPLFTVK